ncbi:ABC transporter substrate-binding protein [Halococcus saccharolyticus]|uniref:Putative extracellular ligand binding protein n=1 Tax=Halococcus saccharolyticus DSM 5350 TaxID=1227455 RepID=M0MRK4_9EURY|nr:ABC transporter substrate-binding protein [Halococcus saccharolyticus]EMA47075.1 putative extracellular ligand binding protein [Halococcus saccharolyticus DSM 5350]
MGHRPKRREFLAAVGTAGIVGVAGCSGGGNGGGGNETGGEGGGDTTEAGGGGGAEETETEASGETEGGETTGEETEGGETTGEETEGGNETGGNETGGGGSAEGREIMVGVLQPTTGDLASVGEPIQQAALLPAVQLEGSDMAFTINTQAEDTQTDPQAGISAAQALVDAGYPAITGAASSETTIQVAQNVTIPNEIVLTSPASTSPAITDLQDNGYVYRTPPSDALQSEVLAQVASERVGASSVSVMFVNNSYGQALAEAFASAFGGEVPAQVSFEKAQSSYTSKLQEAMASSPGALLVIGYPESGNQLFRDYYSNYSRDTQILVTDGLRDSALPGNVGQPLTNVLGTAPLAAGPAREFFTQSFQDEYGGEPGVFTSQAYDATAIQILANAAGGENSGPAVQENMDAVANPPGTEVGPENLAEAIGMAASGEEINYQGASSNITFDDNGDIAAATYEVFTYTEDGSIEQADTVQFGGSGGGGGTGNNSSASGNNSSG